MKVQLAAIALGLLGGNATAQVFEFKGFEIGGTKEAFLAKNP